ncbi:hypothetical protein B296_00036383 [Ensete ventricosum]|uniref:Uncharacterized protein n=1 Tax=Ensete ventricosum TaxID=4639 RepID=A0A426YAK9_ENSVE|nr:hypothetical protein B296_00036383 [Ensete ventricosum]
MIPEYRIQKTTTTISNIVRPSRVAGQIHGVKQEKEKPLKDNDTNLLDKQKGQVQKESGLQRLQVRLRRGKKAMPRRLLLHLHRPRRRFRRPIHLGSCSARTPYKGSTRGKRLLPSRSCRRRQLIVVSGTAMGGGLLSLPALPSAAAAFDGTAVGSGGRRPPMVAGPDGVRRPC